jgi:hypothetical protein
MLYHQYSKMPKEHMHNSNRKKDSMSPAENNHRKVLTIIVNATPHEWTDEEITYSQVVQIAYPGEVVSANSTFKVSYMKKNGHNLDPLVYSSSPVKVKEGMVFNVTPANRA